MFNCAQKYDKKPSIWKVNSKNLRLTHYSIQLTVLQLFRMLKFLLKVNMRNLVAAKNDSIYLTC